MENLKKSLAQSLCKYYENVKNLRIAIIAGVDGVSTIYDDYPTHSITSSLCDSDDIEYYLTLLQNDGAYATVYFNFLDFVKEYSNNSHYIVPNLIFETSPIPSVNKTRDQIVPAFLDLLKIRHLGANASLNAFCNNKYVWNRFFLAHNIPVPQSHLFCDGEWASLPDNGKPYILKLNYECTSIGITDNSVFCNIKELTDNARRLCVEFQQPVIAQEFINGHEIETPILAYNERTLVLPSMEIISNDGMALNKKFLNYERRFKENYEMKRFDINNPEECLRIQKYILQISRLFQMDGYMRLDCRVDDEGSIYFFDFNNDPAINQNSSFYASLNSLGFDKDDVLRIIIGSALK